MKLLTDEQVSAIRLTLSATHNCIATDLVEAEEDETHWRIDNSTALAILDKAQEQPAPVDYTILYQLVELLPSPQNRKWTATERDKWITAWNAIVDLYVTVESESI